MAYIPHFKTNRHSKQEEGAVLHEHLVSLDPVQIAWETVAEQELLSPIPRRSMRIMASTPRNREDGHVFR
jgi:hypothetical protein